MMEKQQGIQVTYARPVVTVALGKVNCKHKSRGDVIFRARQRRRLTEHGKDAMRRMINGLVDIGITRNTKLSVWRQVL